MARYVKDRGARSLSISPAIPATSPKENANTTPKNNGTATGPGDEFVYVPGTSGAGNQYPQNLSWDVSVSAAGTMAALIVNLEGSDDGFVTVATVDTINSLTGGTKSVANPGFQMYRSNIGTFTAAAGSPVVTSGITM